MTRDEVIAIWRKECQKAGSQRAWAKNHGLSPAYVSDIIAGNRGGRIISDAVLNALNLEAVVSYRRSRNGWND